LGECISVVGLLGSAATSKYLKEGIFKSRNFPIMFIVEILLIFTVQIVYKKVSDISLIDFMVIYSLVYSVLIMIFYVALSKLKGKIFGRSDLLYDFNDKINFAYNYLLDKYNITTKIYLLKNSKISATAIINKDHLNIYIQDYIYGKLNDAELSLLILHEFAHIKYKHTQKWIIFYAMPIFLFTLISSVYVFGFTYPYQFYYVVISFIYLSISLFMYNKINLHNEVEADRFAMGILNDRNNMKALLDKAYDFVLTNTNAVKNKQRTLNFKNKRIKKFDGFNETNEYK
jgi:Zn-dependent protease with chaperone function